jgi:hypothetical protein
MLIVPKFYMFVECVLGMEAASPDLEKQGFFAVVFVNREYSVQPDPTFSGGKHPNYYITI